MLLSDALVVDVAEEEKSARAALCMFVYYIFVIKNNVYTLPFVVHELLCLFVCVSLLFFTLSQDGISMLRTHTFARMAAWKLFVADAFANAVALPPNAADAFASSSLFKLSK